MHLINHIKEYKKNNPNAGYFTMAKIFGLPTEDIIKLFWFDKYDIDSDTIRFYKNDKAVYIEQHGYHHTLKYNNYGKLIYSIDSNDNWEKWKYNDYGKEIYYENSDAHWRKKDYDERGREIRVEESTGNIEEYSYVGNWRYQSN